MTQMIMINTDKSYKIIKNLRHQRSNYFFIFFKKKNLFTFGNSILKPKK